MRGKVFGFLLVLVFLSGCAECTVMRSEYCDVTGKIFMPKAPKEDIEVFEGEPDKPYEEIGLVKAVARINIPHKKLVEEMKRRAKMVGADAIANIRYEENVSARFLMCTRMGTTKKTVTATATAIIFKDKS